MVQNTDGRLNRFFSYDLSIFLKYRSNFPNPNKIGLTRPIRRSDGFRPNFGQNGFRVGIFFFLCSPLIQSDYSVGTFKSFLLLQKVFKINEKKNLVQNRFKKKI